ncbi:MAG: YgiQ family radical SAM protein [Lachnospiraceae bacterium]|nr:YgiQ family radical SAM protein [Lachnospiraceae bacterium]
MSKYKGFLPVCKEDLQTKGIKQLDFVYVLGDAYIDHPSFGAAIIGRVLEHNGYTVGIIAQPDFRNADSILSLGIPRLAFLVSSGNMDSMINHYYVSKKRRTKDAYTPGGEIGKRPDRAVIVYCNMIRKHCKDIPIIVGGIEASLRRLAHYDYWSDSFRRSILLESGADLVSYGMGEKSIVEIADALNAGINIKDITYVPGTVYKRKVLKDDFAEAIFLPTYEEMLADKKKYGDSFLIQSQNTDPINGRTLIEKYSEHCYIIQNPPALPLSEKEMDEVYNLPYMRAIHPSYKALGGIPAIEEVRFSLTSNRGCFGSCNFCSLAFHQGRIVQTRSHESLISEAEQIINMPDFKGYIHDVGGPTANFRHPACKNQLKTGACKNKKCLFPTPCKNLDADHSDYIALLRKLRSLKKVKKVFVRSGVRFDYLLADKDDAFLKELVEHHISGQLKVAPEHVSDQVLNKMGKPSFAVYKRFVAKYEKYNKEFKKNQYLVPYFMSSHPGSTLKDAVALAEYIRDTGYIPEQVQDYYPTPSTMSTVMYYTEIDPRDGKPVYVAKNPHEKALQRALIQYSNPENYDLVKEALQICGRQDLIGFGEKCLIRPRKLAKEKKDLQNTNNKSNTQKNLSHKQKISKNGKNANYIMKKKQASGKDKLNDRKRKR